MYTSLLYSRKIYVIACIMTLFSATPPIAYGNSITVNNFSFKGQNIVSHYNFIQFDISWDNSWRTSSAPVNWDAAWVFAKYRLKNSNVWKHVTLNTAGHTAPTGSTITGCTDGMGAFIYRSGNGTGTFSLTGVQLRWNYGTDGLTDNDLVEVKVYAIEMVYVPQGSFSLGSGGSEVDAFYKYPTTTNVYPITSENAITVGTASGNLYYTSINFGGDRGGPIPAAFPKGYNAFYCMKYEISQEQYVNFLNTLTRTQQQQRVDNDISGTSTLNRFVMAPPYDNPTVMNFRNGIRCDATLPASPTPVTFYCDYNQNGIGGQAADGQTIACNYLSMNDVLAILDWSGLRPFTELEFEKACRGTAAAVANEYAWGTTTTACCLYTLSNAGKANEGIATNYHATYGNANSGNTSNRDLGPVRNGIFAANGSNTGRITAGATYYGIMEMSGNLWERAITVGIAEGRAYTGLHGNGTLDAAGNSSTTNWPGTDCKGGSFRGGDFTNDIEVMRTSDRDAGAYLYTYRDRHVGGRGVRTAP